MWLPSFGPKVRPGGRVRTDRLLKCSGRAPAPLSNLLSTKALLTESASAGMRLELELVFSALARGTESGRGEGHSRCVPWEVSATTRPPPPSSEAGPTDPSSPTGSLTQPPGARGPRAGAGSAVLPTPPAAPLHQPAHPASSPPPTVTLSHLPTSGQVAQATDLPGKEREPQRL